jgi:hypothetical protein
MPWDASSFSKHNKHATVHQLRKAAERANEVLEATGDEGAAVRAGNALIKRMKHGKGKD